MNHHQVIIVGGGPAGAACAGELVKAGLDCVILDKARFPRQKVCAGWITPAVLNDLGLPPSHYPYGLSEFPSLRIKLGSIPFSLRGPQYAIRRIEFDDWLLKRSGAEVIQHEVKQILTEADRYLIDGRYSADYLVGAGGTLCPVYQHFFKEDSPRDGSQIAALEEEYEADWQDPVCRLWFFQGGLPGYAWYVPKTGGYVNIGLGGNAAALNERGKSLREHWEQFAAYLVAARLVEHRSFNPRGYTYYLRGAASTFNKNHLYLVGDSAGLSTLDMGEGIGPAIRSGLLAARSILDGTPYDLEGISRFSLLPSGLRWLVGNRS